MLDPGLFVFGYPGQSVTPQPPPPPPWIKNGSFMVFRRLQQRVPEFGQFISSESARLQVDRVLLGARLVGRWKSGAPLLLLPARTTLRSRRTRNKTTTSTFPTTRASGGARLVPTLERPTRARTSASLWDTQHPKRMSHLIGLFVKEFPTDNGGERCRTD